MPAHARKLVPRGANLIVFIGQRSPLSMSTATGLRWLWPLSCDQRTERSYASAAAERPELERRVRSCKNGALFGHRNAIRF